MSALIRPSVDLHSIITQCLMTSAVGLYQLRPSLSADESEAGSASPQWHPSWYQGVLEGALQQKDHFCFLVRGKHAPPNACSQAFVLDAICIMWKYDFSCCCLIAGFHSNAPIRDPLWGDLQNCHSKVSQVCQNSEGLHQVLWTMFWAELMGFLLKLSSPVPQFPSLLFICFPSPNFVYFRLHCCAIQSTSLLLNLALLILTRLPSHFVRSMQTTSIYNLTLFFLSFSSFPCLPFLQVFAWDQERSLEGSEIWFAGWQLWTGKLLHDLQAEMQRKAWPVLAPGFAIDGLGMLQQMAGMPLHAVPALQRDSTTDVLKPMLFAGPSRGCKRSTVCCQHWSRWRPF